MGHNGQLVRDFIAAWSRLDVDELLGYFATDGIYHNMPIAPVQGQAALRAFITGFVADWRTTEWELLTLVEQGDTVIAERIDRTTTHDGKQIELPCCGVFRLSDGKIAAWRDYFDLNTYAAALAR